jgi:hypothetical protein
VTDYYIFGFGLLVTLLVGSGITTMIIANNRAAEVQERGSEVSSAAGPARTGERD